MGLKDIFGGGGEDYLHIDTPAEEHVKREVLIEVEKMENFSDSDRIQKKIRDGNVLLVKIRDLRSKDPTELRRAIERVKKTCMAIDGDIAGVGEDWLIVSGPYAKVQREESGLGK